MRWSLSSSLLCTILATAFSASPAFAKDSSDITQFGHDVRIEADQTADQVTCFGCSVYVRGQVAGGMIAGEVTSFWGDVRAADNTKLAGDITVMGGSLRRQPTATVAGEVTTFQSRGLVLIILLSPFVVLGGIIALVIWLVRHNRRSTPAMARAA